MVLCSVWVATPAAAEHTADEQITDSTAYTLRDGEARVGLWKVEYGLLDRLDLGTYTWPWLAKIASLSGKYEWYRSESWSVANKLSVLRLDLQDWSEESEPAVFQVVPVEMGVSYRFNESWTLSVEGIYTNVSAEGSYNEDDLNGAAAVTNFQWTSTVEWRWTETLAVLLHLRSLAFQGTSGSGSSVTMPDAYTTVEVYGEAQSDVLDVEGASSATLILHWAWSTFNLRVGLGYGNWSLPGVNFVLPEKTYIPEFDLFWRW
ncbi:MAG: hypothetical protein CMH57_07365 [Myxococcales bacterium]|nr:hypothetical protein [Myxococcales bacterium]